MRFLFIGFLLVWVVLFGYTLYLQSQQRQLTRELALLKDVVGRKNA
jgi:CcmD family protein